MFWDLIFLCILLKFEWGHSQWGGGSKCGQDRLKLVILSQYLASSQKLGKRSTYCERRFISWHFFLQVPQFIHNVPFELLSEQFCY